MIKIHLSSVFFDVFSEQSAHSGGRMGEGQEEDSEEEHDVLRTYMEIYDDNFDYEF